MTAYRLPFSCLDHDSSPPQTTPAFSSGWGTVQDTCGLRLGRLKEGDKTRRLLITSPPPREKRVPPSISRRTCVVQKQRLSLHSRSFRASSPAMRMSRALPDAGCALLLYALLVLHLHTSFAFESSSLYRWTMKMYEPFYIFVTHYHPPTPILSH